MSSLSEQITPERIVGNTPPIHLTAKRQITVIDSPTPTSLPREGNKMERRALPTPTARGRTGWQFVRFGLVGCLNTTIDVLVLNGLLWLWPAQSIVRLVMFNSLAYAFGALNSFVFNRSWTFQRTGRPTAREGARFLLVTLAAITCNGLILWEMSNLLHPAHLTPTLWTNTSKVAAIGGTILVSYLGMRLWVFVQSPHKHQRVFGALFQRGGKSSLLDRHHRRTLVSRVESEPRSVHCSPHTRNV